MELIVCAILYLELDNAYTDLLVIFTIGQL